MIKVISYKITSKKIQPDNIRGCLVRWRKVNKECFTQEEFDKYRQRITNTAKKRYKFEIVVDFAYIEKP